jgi:hypothetical protein
MNIGFEAICNKCENIEDLNELFKQVKGGEKDGNKSM